MPVRAALSLPLRIGGPAGEVEPRSRRRRGRRVAGGDEVGGGAERVARLPARPDAVVRLGRLDGGGLGLVVEQLAEADPGRSRERRHVRALGHLAVERVGGGLPPGRRLDLRQGVARAHGHGRLGRLGQDPPVQRRRALRLADRQEVGVAELVAQPGELDDDLVARVLGARDGREVQRCGTGLSGPGPELQLPLDGLAAGRGLDGVEAAPVGEARAVAPDLLEGDAPLLYARRVAVAEETRGRGAQPAAVLGAVAEAVAAPGGAAERLRGPPTGEGLAVLEPSEAALLFAEGAEALRLDLGDPRLERLVVEGAEGEERVGLLDPAERGGDAAERLGRGRRVEHGRAGGALAGLERGGAERGRGRVEVGGGPDVVVADVAEELAEAVVRLAAQAADGEGVVVEDVAEAPLGGVRLAGGGEQARVDELDLGAAGVVLVVAPHGAHEGERLVGAAGVDPEHERAAHLGAVAELVGAGAGVRLAVGVGGGVPAPGVLLHLPEQEVGARGEVAVAGLGRSRAERLGGGVPLPVTGVELAQRQRQLGAPPAVGVGPLRRLAQDGHAVLEPLGGGERAAEPERRLGRELALPPRLSRRHRLAELLLGPDDVALVEVRLADEQERVVGPLRVRPVAEELGALVDGLLERPAGGAAAALREQRHEAGPVDGLVGPRDLVLALFELALGVVVRVVVRPEVAVAPVQGRPRPAPGEDDQATEEGERDAQARTTHGPGGA